MTLGIGVLCNKGETIVLGSEQRASYNVGSTVAIDPNDETGKIYRLTPHRVFVSVAGSMSVCHEVYSQFMHLVEHLKKGTEISSELAAYLLNEARFHQLKRIYDWQLRRKMGVTLTQWAQGKIHGGKMSRLIVKFGHEILENTPFKCEMIVCGFIEPHGIFLRASQKEHIQEETSLGVYAIGCGQVAAIRHLNKRGQNVHMSLARTLLHVYEALYISQSQYVGPPPEFLLVMWRRNGTVAVYPTALLEAWRKQFETRPLTASLDDSRTASQEVLLRLKELKEGNGNGN